MTTETQQATNVVASTADPLQWHVARRDVPFEEHKPGRVFEHHWGRTIYPAENAAFSTQMLAFNPLYFNEDAAARAGRSSTVVNPMLVFGVVFGLSVEDLSESGGAFLGASDLEFLAEVTPGDTLYAHSVVEDARPSRSHLDKGIVRWLTTGTDQTGREVIRFRRTNLISKQDHEPRFVVPETAADWREGMRFRHHRSRTITDLDLNGFTLSVMNTASGHFSEHAMADTDFGSRINFGGLTLSLVIGLATQDTTVGFEREVSLDEVRFPAPVRCGDTISAATEVLSVTNQPDDRVLISFRHTGLNQHGKTVCVAERTVLATTRP